MIALVSTIRAIRNFRIHLFTVFGMDTCTAYLNKNCLLHVVKYPSTMEFRENVVLSLRYKVAGMSPLPKDVSLWTISTATVF